MIYEHKAGFRNGSCSAFPIFDFENRVELSMHELPLLFMETPYRNMKLLQDVVAVCHKNTQLCIATDSSHDLLIDFRKFLHIINSCLDLPV